MLLDAPFVAVMQIIVYAGAIMVLFLFVVMLLNAPREDARRVGPRRIRCSGPAPVRFGAAARRRCSSLELGWALRRRRARRRRWARDADGALSQLGARASAACCSPTTRSRSKRRRS